MLIIIVQIIKDIDYLKDKAAYHYKRKTQKYSDYLWGTLLDIVPYWLLTVHLRRTADLYIKQELFYFLTSLNAKKGDTQHIEAH